MACGTAITGSDGLSYVTNRPAVFGCQRCKQLMFRDAKAATDIVGIVAGFVNGRECCSLLHKPIVSPWYIETQSHFRIARNSTQGMSGFCIV